jgi:iron complex outermembrane receptor protein
MLILQKPTTRSPLTLTTFRKPFIGACACSLFFLGSPALLAQNLDADEILGLGIEALMNIEIVSASKYRQPLSDAASAVFVITQEDIRRSGAANIPEALRLAPGLQVARLDASRYAITARGFNGRFANKLLVLMDGRSIYTPTFSGVYWENLGPIVNEVERIEVIRGPGASVWGANAVNGVINIITKNAKDTLGSQIQVRAGNDKQPIATARYGLTLGDKAALRLTGRFARYDESVTKDGRRATDDGQLGGGNFRLDWQPTAADNVQLQGGFSRGEFGQDLVIPDVRPPYSRAVNTDARNTTAHFLTRWDHLLSSSSQVGVQFSYQRDDVEDVFLARNRDTLNVDFQHTLDMGPAHRLIWGLGYRYSEDHFTNSPLAHFVPDDRADHLVNLFIQDERLFFEDQLRFTLGSKFEYNSYTGIEIQPSVRLLWTPDARQRLWGAVSRAARTPSRVEDSIRLDNLVIPPNPLTPLPLVGVLTGNRGLDAEEVWAFEAGYRNWLGEHLSFDVATFYNRYNELIGYELGAVRLGQRDNIPVLIQPLNFVNIDGVATSYGLELAADWRVREGWRLQLAYGFIEDDLNDTFSTSPRHNVSLRSAFDLSARLELDVWLRYMDDVLIVTSRPNLNSAVDDYFALDLRLGWRASSDLELSIGAQNLLDNRHQESIQEFAGVPIEIERSLYGEVRWSF